MSAPGSLLEAVLAAPADDAPRLVFADWFEENGDAPRAQLIRDQIEIEGLEPWTARNRQLRQRIRRTLAQHGRRWLAALGPVDGIRFRAFRRGFVDTVRVDEPDALKGIDAVRARTPLDTLEIDVEERTPSEIPALRWVRHLRIGEAYELEPEMVEALLDKTDPAVLRTFDAASAGIENAGAHQLAKSPHLPGLERLILTNCFVGSEGLTALAEAGLPNVRELRLACFGSGYVDDPFVDDAAMEALAKRGAPALETLTIDANRVTNRGIRALLESQALPRLRHISARYSDISTDAFRDLKPGPIRLRALELEGCTAPALGRSAQLSELALLDLSGIGMPPEALEDLAKSAHSQTLESLRLANNRLGADALVGLTHSGWPRLHTLDLTNNPLGADAGLLLSQVDLPALRDLRMGRSQLGAGLTKLATAAWMPTLESLQIYDCRIPGDALGALARMATPRRIRLGSNRLGQVALDGLPDGAWREVEDLDLACHLDDAAVQALRRLGPFDALLTLSLATSTAEPDTLRALFEAGMPRLRELKLDNCSVGPVLPDLLAQLPELTSLSVVRCGLDDATMRLFLEPPLAERLTHVQGWGNDASQETWAEVSERSYAPHDAAWMFADPVREGW